MRSRNQVRTTGAFDPNRAEILNEVGIERMDSLATAVTMPATVLLMSWRKLAFEDPPVKRPLTGAST